MLITVFYSVDLGDGFIKLGCINMQRIKPKCLNELDDLIKELINTLAIRNKVADSNVVITSIKEW